MGILGRLDAEGAEQRDVLGGVAQVIFSPRMTCVTSFPGIHYVDEVEHRLPIGAHDDEVRVHLLAVGQFARTSPTTRSGIRIGARLILNLTAPSCS